MGESDSLLLNLVTQTSRVFGKKNKGKKPEDESPNSREKEVKPDGKAPTDLQDDKRSSSIFEKRKRHKLKASHLAQAKGAPNIHKSDEDAKSQDKESERLVSHSVSSKSGQHLPNQTPAGKFQSNPALVKTSSLFKHNPEIPHVELSFVKPKTEPLFSSQNFSDLPIHPYLIACLRDRVQVTTMTVVQQRTIPLLLQGKDCLVKSATGSGKTLAFAVPIVHALQEVKPKLQRKDGVHALVVVPTRELAIQCYEHFSTLCRSFAWLVPGCLMGGEKKKSEKARIRKGVTILISTPGRLLDHLQHTTNLSLKKVCWFVIDEADRLLDLGFEKAVSEIVSKLREQRGSDRQTVLLSATLTKGVEKLAGMSLNNPAVVDVSAKSGQSSLVGDMFVIPPQLKQHFLITPVKLRLVVLSAFIVDKCALGRCKALIFMMTQDVVDFHHSLFSGVLKDAMKSSGFAVSFFHLHGNMNQQERTDVFKNFREAESGILLCTDVAARGLDLPNVDWIVQYSAPTRAEDYVHRVGRTARIGSEGRSLLFLLPTEVGFIDLLQQHRIKLEQLDMQKLLQSLLLIEPDANKKFKAHPALEEQASYLQGRYENVVSEHGTLFESATKAYTSYVRAYASYPHSLRNMFPFKSLHLGHVAKSMCLREAPSVLGHRQSQKLAMQHTQKLKSMKKKRKLEISEYDSGLDFQKLKKRKTKVV